MLLGAALKAEGRSSVEVGVLLTAVLAGTALMSGLVGTVADRVGRRRSYGLLFLGLAGAGAAFGLTTQLLILVLVALSGTLSTEVVEAGPFSSLEQSMLAAAAAPRARSRLYGTYNAVAALVGSAGALLSGLPGWLHRAGLPAPSAQRLFLAFVPIGILAALLALTLSDAIEATPAQQGSRVLLPLGPSRAKVFGLAALFATDAFGGGFVVQSFLVYWFSLRWGIPLEMLSVVFFLANLLQAASFVVAMRLSERIGLLNTMVFTHLPSHLFLAAIPLVPNAFFAVGLLLARSALSAMDLPARQAYLMAMVEPSERTAAAAYTTAARSAVRPVAPVLGGAAQQLAIGLPFFIGAGIKVIYDLLLFAGFRGVGPKLADHEVGHPRAAED